MLSFRRVFPRNTLCLGRWDATGKGATSVRKNKKLRVPPCEAGQLITTMATRLGKGALGAANPAVQAG